MMNGGTIKVHRFCTVMISLALSLCTVGQGISGPQITLNSSSGLMGKIMHKHEDNISSSLFDMDYLF